ncbi:hypothetical protein EVAR_39188_1 [Eumeta japonica]|uniref:Uncharacterized protein n=1 Tax=Eumeta variegata TaxID=151549 RepID=A0A4C1VN61_EUMVA|nr:hypothetical protein EVAR_39188_1 [Eumeta japonica]
MDSGTVKGLLLHTSTLGSLVLFRRLFYIIFYDEDLIMKQGFQSSNFDVKDEPRSDRLITDKIDSILDKVEKDRHISSYGIPEELAVEHWIYVIRRAMGARLCGPVVYLTKCLYAEPYYERPVRRPSAASSPAPAGDYNVICLSRIFPENI